MHANVNTTSSGRGIVKAGLVVALISVTGCAAEAPDHDGGGAGGKPVAVTRQALGSKPHASCTSAFHDDHGYWFCPTNASFNAAKTACQATDVNTKLVSIDNAAENAFLQANVGLDARIGASDSAVESAWRWDNGSVQFWSGGSGGSPVGGRYANWDIPLGQPNNGGLFGNEDCALISAISGKWFDVSCTTGYWYVCEEDLCPSDPIKEAPGQCGCGVSDADTDGDGTVDCQDECPNDISKTIAGDCGCPSSPEAVGSPCNDGLCAANKQCNGAGSCGTAAQCGVPDSQCTSSTRAGITYWYCDNDRTYNDARKRCQAIGMDLAVVETAAEDAYITDHISEHTFLGGTDQVVEGTWRWESTGRTFFVGGPSGSPFEGAYTNWEPGQPSQSLSSYDCLVKDPPIGAGKWEVRSCAALEAYACESVGPIEDIQDCVDQIQPRSDLTGVALERWYQAEILRRCAARGDSACLQDLRGRINLDYTTAALALASQQKTPAQYLAIVRDRGRKARAFETVAGLADLLCSGDSDGDFVPNGTDACPGTPPLTPTNDSGCTDNSLPAAPSADDVKNILDNMGFAFNAACSGTKILQQPSLGGFYWPSDLARGVFVFASRANNQVPDCPVWYVFDIEEIVTSSSPKGYDVVQRYQVTFKETEETTALMGTTAPVPSFAVQFQALVTDSGTRGKLGGTGTLIKFGGINGVRFRVKVFNGGGIQSAWSSWRLTQTPGDCAVLGFDCAN